MNAYMPQIENFPKADLAWLRDDAVLRLVEVFDEVGDDLIRFVGGCVRDSLLGHTLHDIDIATRLVPDEAMRVLSDAGVKVIPTGLDHGTITAVIDKRAFEITTLRADIETDGRHASVEFTQDWARDARRRDFTINALYLTPGAEIFDDTGGCEDLAAGVVRFVGDAQHRIREDYLRILRFFRFSARFANEYDDNGLDACAREREGLSQLSAERIGNELLQILSLPNAADVAAKMIEVGVLAELIDHAPDIAALTGVKATAPNTNGVLALAALYPSGDASLWHRLVLSNAQKARAQAALENRDILTGCFEGGSCDVRALRATIYQMGQAEFCDAALLAVGAKVMVNEEYHRVINLAQDWETPKFPLSGKDITAAGIDPGPKIGMILKSIERQWIEEDFPQESRLQEIQDAAIDQFR